MQMPTPLQTGKSSLYVRVRHCERHKHMQQRRTNLVLANIVALFLALVARIAEVSVAPAEIGRQIAAELALVLTRKHVQ